MGFTAWQFSLGIFALMGSALAQDGTETVANRTPANAQKFIAVTPPEAFQIGIVNAVFEGEVTSPDICRTTMSGKLATFKDSKFVAVAPEASQISMAPIGVELDEKGLLRVIKGESAFDAGLRNGDKLVSLNGQPVNSSEEFKIFISKMAVVDRPLIFDVLSPGRGARIARTVTVIPRSDPNAKFVEMPTDLATETVPPVQMTIDWSKVQQVAPGGSREPYHIGIGTPGDKQRWLYYSVAETRDRVLAAAQYLKTACDQAAELGF